MLVVTRKSGQRILIPSLGVEILVSKVLGASQVRIGVSAPGHKIIRDDEVRPDPNEARNDRAVR